MKKIKAHFNQVVTPKNQLQDGEGLYIDLKYHIEMPNEVLAYKAMYYSFDEKGNETKEKRSVDDAMNEWAYHISRDARGIDGVLAVLCHDKIWRKVIWFDDYGEGKAFSTKG